MSKNIEVELKYQLKNVANVIGILDEIAGFIDDETQIDTYYNSPRKNFLVYKNNISHWFRVREEERGSSINYKIWQPEDSEHQTHSLEYESQISSPESIHKMFVALGFEFLVAVKKKRRRYLLGSIEISIDQVDGLGEYIELEYKGELDTIENARERLFTCISEIGADVCERDKIGYPYALLIKQGKVPSP